MLSDEKWKYSSCIGAVDGPLAAYAIAIKDNINHHININFNNAAINFIARDIALVKHASSYIMGVKSPDIISGGGGGGTGGGTPQPKTIPALFGGSCTLQPSDPLYNSPPTYLFDCLGITEFGIDMINVVGIIVSPFGVFF